MQPTIQLNAYFISQIKIFDH